MMTSTYVQAVGREHLTLTVVPQWTGGQCT